jgi:DNA-binding LacI/PurR family transcriptional regulator
MGRVAMKLMAEEIKGTPSQPYVTVQPLLVTRETIDSTAIRETLDLAWYKQ